MEPLLPERTPPTGSSDPRAELTEVAEQSVSSPIVVPFMRTRLEGGLMELNAPLHQRSAERLCFICLDGSEADETNNLVQCCTRCFTVAHTRCWREWRGSQANHARRARLSGNRVRMDPFICSICKSGSARLSGERVTVRWLESFANFASHTGHSVRFASGLFSALSGARNERAPDEETDSDMGEDFLEFIEEGGVDNMRLLVGNVRRFFLVNIIVIFCFILSVLICNDFGLIETSFIVMSSIIAILAYVILVTTYIFSRYERLLNHRRLVSDIGADVLSNLVAYLGSSPQSHFRLRASCKACYELMPDTLRVPHDIFELYVDLDNRYQKGLRLICTTDPFDLPIVCALGALESWEDRAEHWKYLLKDKRIRISDRMTHEELVALMQFSFASNDVVRFREALVVLGYPAPLPDYWPTRYAHMIQIYMEMFREDVDMIAESLLYHAVRGGQEKCVDRILETVAADLSDFGDIKLYDCAYGGNVELMKRLKGEGVEVGELPSMELEAAIDSNNPKVLEFLIKNGLDVAYAGEDLENEACQTALTLFADVDPTRTKKIPNLEIAKLLVDNKCDVNLEDGSGSTPLRVAAYNGWEHVCKFLMDNGAIGDFSDVCGYPFSEKIATIFLDGGCDMNKKIKSSRFGFPITIAAAEGNLKAVQFMVDRGVNVFVKGGTDGHTPLTAFLEMWYEGRSLETFSLLLDKHPKLATFPNGKGFLPLYFVPRSKLSVSAKAEVEALLVNAGATPHFLYGPDYFASMPTQQKRKMSLKQFHTFLKRGATIDCALRAFSNTGNKPIMGELAQMQVDEYRKFTREKLSTELVRAVNDPSTSLDVIVGLIAKGADVNTFSRKGISLLQSAFLRKDFVVCDLLIDRGADVGKLVDPSGISCLFRAALEGRAGSVEYLLEKGADPCIPNSAGLLPIDFATFVWEYFFRHGGFRRCPQGSVKLEGHGKPIKSNVREYIRIMELLAPFGESTKPWGEDILLFARQHGFTNIKKGLIKTAKREARVQTRARE